MRSRARRRGDAYRDKERKSHLPQIVGLPGVGANQIAQRPLQEQKRDQRQCQPLGGGHEGADQAIEAAQEDRHIAIPLIEFRLVMPAYRSGLAGWRRSADRTRLPANSLLTGNFTGKSAISGLPDSIS